MNASFLNFYSNQSRKPHQECLYNHYWPKSPQKSKSMLQLGSSVGRTASLTQQHFRVILMGLKPYRTSFDSAVMTALMLQCYKRCLLQETNPTPQHNTNSNAKNHKKRNMDCACLLETSQSKDFHPGTKVKKNQGNRWQFIPTGMQV